MMLTLAGFLDANGKATDAQLAAGYLCLGYANTIDDDSFPESDDSRTNLVSYPREGFNNGPAPLEVTANQSEAPWEWLVSSRSASACSP